MTNDEEYAYYDNRMWSVFASMEFSDWDGEVKEGDVGPRIELEATVSFDWRHLKPIAQRKADYLGLSHAGKLTDEELITALATDIETTHDIIFNKVSPNYPEETLYYHTPSGQWKTQDPEDYYPKYKELLESITETYEGIPSIPELHRPFLEAVAESSDYELPPLGIVRDILSEHIESIRAEQKAREGESELKQELESHGIDARTAANVANSIESKGLLKEDAQLDN